MHALCQGNVIHHTPIERDTRDAAFAVTGIVQRDAVRVSVNHAALLGYHHV